MHETQPAHVKSMLLVGPKGTGKKSLVAALAHDVGANLFDLTPSNTAGKYTAKKGLDGIDGLLHKVCGQCPCVRSLCVWSPCGISVCHLCIQRVGSLCGISV